ncbi:MAG: hypothetical protein IV100_24255 [Myxococcales bacterium]|nr:hypothetical protein [Myxococcales bacterium]
MEAAWASFKRDGRRTSHSWDTELPSTAKLVWSVDLGTAAHEGSPAVLDAQPDDLDVDRADLSR